MSLAVLVASTTLAPADPLDIVGGSDVPPGKWPDTVAVIGKFGKCTGTLVAPDVVLTAGHCAYIEPTTVVANSIDYASPGGTLAGVSRTIVYPNWQASYDISVVVLAQPISTVTPRRIGTECTYRDFTWSTKVRIVGFGATTMDGKTGNTRLMEAITSVTDPRCDDGNGCNPLIAPGGEFVAGGEGVADSCFGDSGGPVYLDTPGGAVLVGAVSRGVEDAETPCGGGGIYVRTDKIVRWAEASAGRVLAKDNCQADAGGDERDDGDGGGDDLLGGCSAAPSAGWGVLAFAALASAWRRRGR